MKNASIQVNVEKRIVNVGLRLVYSWLIATMVLSTVG